MVGLLIVTMMHSLHLFVIRCGQVIENIPRKMWELHEMLQLKGSQEVTYIFNILGRPWRGLLTEVSADAACIVKSRNLAIALLLLIECQVISALKPCQYCCMTKMPSELTILKQHKMLPQIYTKLGNVSSDSVRTLCFFKDLIHLMVNKFEPCLSYMTVQVICRYLQCGCMSCWQSQRRWAICRPPKQFPHSYTRCSSQSSATQVPIALLLQASGWRWIMLLPVWGKTYHIKDFLGSASYGKPCVSMFLTSCKCDCYLRLPQRLTNRHFACQHRQGCLGIKLTVLRIR